METFLCILLIILAIFLVIAVLMQHGKSANLSGTIAGGAETFFGKTKGRTIDAMLSKVTTIVAIIFVILVLVVYLIQPGTEDATKVTGNVTATATTETVTATQESTAATATVTEETTGADTAATATATGVQ